MSGSTASTIQVVTGSISATLESAVNGQLDSLKHLTKIITISQRVVKKMCESTGEDCSEGEEEVSMTPDSGTEMTSASGTEKSGPVSLSATTPSMSGSTGPGMETESYEATGAEFITVCTEYNELLNLDMSSLRVVRNSLSILSMKVTLTTEEITKIKTLKTSLQTEVAKMEQKKLLMDDAYKLVADTEVMYTQVQLFTGKMDGSSDDAVIDGIKEMQLVVKNEDACKAVLSLLEAAIGGTATEGTETTSEEFVTLVKSFMSTASDDFISKSIVTQATLIITAKVTLSSEAMTTIKEHVTSLKNLIVQITIMKSMTNEFIMLFMPRLITPLELAAGKVNADIDSAKMAILLELKALTYSSKAIDMVSAKITSVIDGKATTGDLTTGAEFVVAIETFESLVKANFLDIKVTAHTMKIEMMQVTVSTTETETLSPIKVALDALKVGVEAQMAMVQVTFKSIVGMEATTEEIMGAGSSKAKPSKELNTGRAEVSVVDTILMKMKQLSSSKKSSEKVKDFLEKVTGGTAGDDGTETIDSVTFIKRVSSFMMELKMSFMSMSIMTLELSITLVKFELDSSLEMAVKDFKSDLEMILNEKMSLELLSLQFQFYVETDAEATDIQITAGSKDATKDSAGTAILGDIKHCTIVKDGIKAVMDDLDKALAGTATSGALELTGKIYSTRITNFIEVAEGDLMDNSLLTFTFSLTNLKVTLNEEQITKLTESKSKITTIAARVDAMIANIKEDFKTISGGEATEIQIAAGDSTVTDKDIASSTFMKTLQIITVNKEAVEMVKETLVAAAAGTLTVGEEMTFVEFEGQLGRLIFELIGGFSTSVIAEMSLKFSMVKITLTAEEKVKIEKYQETITGILVEISTSISFYQSQLTTFAGQEATEVQIAVGDASATVETVKAVQIELHGSIDANKVSVETVITLISDIKASGISVTATGTTDMTASEFYMLISDFFMMVSVDFKADVKETMTKISSAKITSELTEYELTSLEVFMFKMETMLMVEMKTTLRVICFQIEVMTGGDIPDICKMSSSTPTMSTMPILTTRGPHMTTKGPSSSMDQGSSTPGKRRIRLNDKLRSALLRNNMNKLK